MPEIERRPPNHVIGYHSCHVMGSPSYQTDPNEHTLAKKQAVPAVQYMWQPGVTVHRCATKYMGTASGKGLNIDICRLATRGRSQQFSAITPS